MDIVPYFFVGIGAFALFMLLAFIIARVLGESSIEDVSNDGVWFILVAWLSTPSVVVGFFFESTSSEELLAFLVGYLLSSVVALFL